MTDLIIRFMNTIIGFAAGAFVIGGGLCGMLYVLDKDPWLIIFYLPLGVIVGLFAVTIILGIPLLALRINQNLEEINSKLKAD